MKKVWTASQGTIHIPSPRPRPERPNKPFERFPPLCANSALSASSVDRVRLRITMRGCFEDLSASAKALFAVPNGLGEFISAQSYPNNHDWHFCPRLPIRIENDLRANLVQTSFTANPQHASHAGGLPETQTLFELMSLVLTIAEQIGLQQSCHYRHQYQFHLH
jgi:hypothetical protein